MYQINLNLRSGLPKLKTLIKNWTDDSGVTVPLILVKVSEAFSMYHQVSQTDLTVHNRSFTSRHSVLINDLDTNENVLLILNQSGTVLHLDLIDDHGHLQRHDKLKKVTSKNSRQEYLDYFYCIAKNIESCVRDRNP